MGDGSTFVVQGDGADAVVHRATERHQGVDDYSVAELKRFRIWCHGLQLNPINTDEISTRYNQVHTKII